MNEVNNYNNEQPVNNQNIGNQMPNQQMNYQNNNQPSNNNKSSNGLMVVIIILLLALIGVVVYAFILKPTDNKKGGSNPNNGTTNNEVQQPQNNETVEKETEVSNIDTYKYLIERLENYGCCSGGLLGLNTDVDKLTDEDKKIFAIYNLKPEENLKTKINKNNDIDYYNGETKKHTIYKLTASDIENANENGVYSAEKVENKVKELFGKNTAVNHEAFDVYVYDKTVKLYYIIRGIGCGCAGGIFEEIDKVTTSGNKLYIYVHAGQEYAVGEVCYDADISEDIETSNKCIDVVKKYSLNENDADFYDQVDEKIAIIKQDKDKFAKYKYTFEKEDNNYIIKKLEKIS